MFFAYIAEGFKYFETPHEQQKHAEYVVLLVNKTRMTLKLKMFFFTVICLGHAIIPEDLNIVVKALEAARVLKCPMTTLELGRSLRLCNDFCWFFINHTNLQPINKPSKNCEPTKFEIRNKERKAVAFLEDNLIFSLFLVIPRSEDQLILEKDIRDWNFGSMLLQKQEKARFDR